MRVNSFSKVRQVFDKLRHVLGNFGMIGWEISYIQHLFIGY